MDTDADSVLVSDTGPAAELVRFKWLEHHDGIMERKGVLLAWTYPARARFKFGAGRL